MIKRRLLTEIKNHLPQKEITLIVGPRQAGKTTLMVFLLEELKQAGRKTIFLNLDVESDKQFFTDQAKLLKKLELELGKDGYVFIDEIQRKEDAGIFLKGIYDMNLGYKFIVSGSGSLELKEKIHESLAGRKRIFELTTLSFLEFADFKTGYAYEGKLEEFFKLDFLKVKELLNEYLEFGGYPRVVLTETLEEKQRTIDEIYRSYVERDITAFLKVEKIEAFTNLVRLLARQIGSLVSISELSSTLGISSLTVQNYLWYLEKTYILRRVTPHFKNARKEISKAPLFYFSDLGLRNYTSGLWGSASDASDAGFLFENFIHLIFFEKTIHTPQGVHFWRSKDGAEVDFVITDGNKTLPVEIKYKSLKSAEIGRSLRNFIFRYDPQEAWVVNLQFEGEIQINLAKVRFLPFYRLPFTQF